MTYFPEAVAALKIAVENWQEDLDGYRNGHAKLPISGEDATIEHIERLEHDIERCQNLISKYEARQI